MAQKRFPEFSENTQVNGFTGCRTKVEQVTKSKNGLGCWPSPFLLEGWKGQVFIYGLLITVPVAPLYSSLFSFESTKIAALRNEKTSKKLLSRNRWRALRYSF